MFLKNHLLNDSKKISLIKNRKFIAIHILMIWDENEMRILENRYQILSVKYIRFIHHKGR